MEKKDRKTNLTPIEVEADGKSGMYGGAWCLAFVYSSRGNFLVKGYHREVDEYIRKTFKQALVNFSLWNSSIFNRGAAHRDIWRFLDDSFVVLDACAPSKHANRSGWTIFDSKMNKVVMEFKRLPNKWIPEFTEMYK